MLYEEDVTIWFMGYRRCDSKPNSSVLGKRCCGIMTKIAMSDTCTGPKGHHLCAGTKRDEERGAAVGFSAVGLGAEVFVLEMVIA